jgi:hypothetical protein
MAKSVPILSTKPPAVTLVALPDQFRPPSSATLINVEIHGILPVYNSLRNDGVLVAFPLQDPQARAPETRAGVPVPDLQLPRPAA